MVSQKGLAPIVVVLIIAVVVGGYLLYQQNTTLTQPTSTIPPPAVIKQDHKDNKVTQTILPEKFDESLILKTITFIDSQGRKKNFIVYTINSTGYADAYITDDAFSTKTAIKIESLSSNLQTGLNSGIYDAARDSQSIFSFNSEGGKRYLVVSYMIGDAQQFEVTDEEGKVTKHILGNVCKAIKGDDPNRVCSIDFESWKDAKSFYAKVIVIPSNDMNNFKKYRVIIDAMTGNVSDTPQLI